MTTAIYTRISRDIVGTSLGVKRQQALCREICEANGWTDIEVYEDNDVSATGSKPRPEYQRLLHDVEAGAVDVIVALDSDRLLRKPGELEYLFELCEAHKVAVRYQTGGFDVATGEGMLEIGIRAQVDAEEVRKLKKRVRRKALELAEAGKVGGGGTRPFGYERDRVTVRESEAKTVRDGVDYLLGGGSLRSLAARWNREGVLTPTGKEWAQSTVRRMITGPRLAGLRQHQGQVLPGVNAVWPAIVSVETRQLLVTTLSDPSRTKRRMPNRRYLLTGLLYTPQGVKLVARPRGDHSRSYFAPGFRALAEPVEVEVVERVFGVLDTDTLAKLLASDRHASGDKRAHMLAAELSKLDVLIERADEARYVTGELDEQRHRSIVRKHEQRREDLEHQLAALPSKGKLPRGLPRGGEALRAWWDASDDVDERKRFLAALIERVVLHPAKPGHNRFDPERVEVLWRV